jgi:hypothetical protein
MARPKKNDTNPTANLGFEAHKEFSPSALVSR